MNPAEEKIVELLTPHLQAVATLEHDGTAYFVDVGLAPENAPLRVTVRLDYTPENIAFMYSPASKQIDFGWTGTYEAISDPDPQKQVDGEASLSLVAHREGWSSDVLFIDATYRIETL